MRRWAGVSPTAGGSHSPSNFSLPHVGPNPTMPHHWDLSPLPPTGLTADPKPALQGPAVHRHLGLEIWPRENATKSKIPSG